MHRDKAGMLCSDINDQFNVGLTQNIYLVALPLDLRT